MLRKMLKLAGSSSSDAPVSLSPTFSSNLERNYVCPDIITCFFMLPDPLQS
jgi:hypothetical protein